MSRSGRRIVLALAVAAGVVGLLALVDRLVPSPSGPPSSSYATAPQGLAAWAEVLRRQGHPVRQVRGGPGELRRGETGVVLDPSDLLPEDARRLARFVRGGGRLVAGGEAPEAWLRFVAPDVEWAPGGESEVRGRLRVRTARLGHWRELGDARSVVGPATRSVVAERALGRGRLLLVADPSPVQNRGLARADDAVLALELAGPRGTPVAFLESVHGFGRASGLAALPSSWRWGLALLALAGGCWVLSQARRLGPPDVPERDLPPPRADYVEAIAMAMLRADRDVREDPPMPSREPDRP